MGKQRDVDEVARALMELGASFHRARLWSRIASDDPFLLRLPGAEHPLLLNVLGSEGGDLGLSAVHGEHALATFEHLVLGPMGAIAASRAPMSMLTFEPLHRLDERMRRHVDASRLPFAAHAAVPLYLSVDPGAGARLMTRTELRAFGKVLQAVLEADRQGVLAPRAWDAKRRMLELTPEGPGRKARILDRVVTLPATVPPPAVTGVPSSWPGERDERDAGRGEAARQGAPTEPPQNRTGWNKVDVQLTQRLMRHGARLDRAHFERAVASYFGDEARGLALLRDDEIGMHKSAFFDWFLFEHRPRRGAATIAESFRREATLSRAEEQLLEARSACETRLARVIAIEEGASVTCEELSAGERFTALDVALSKSATVGLGMLVRCYAVAGHSFLNLAGPAIPPLALREALESVEALGLRFERGRIVGDLGLLGRLWLEPPTRPRPILQNTDGDPFELLLVRYRVPTGYDLASGVRALDDIVEEEEGHWTWLVQRPGRRGFEGGVVMGHFHWVGDELHVEVNSRRRAEQVQAHLAPLTALEVLDVAAMQPSELREHAPRGGGGGRLEDDEAEELQRAVEQSVREHMWQWLDLDIPALGGRTPRQAYADPRQRDAVVRLLRTMPPSEGPLGPIHFDVEPLLRALEE